jgi:hypothetical protein
LDLIYKIMHKAQTDWLPLELASEVNQAMADFYLSIAYRADDADIQLQTFAISRAIDFVFDDDRLLLVSNWIIAHIEGRVEIKGKVLSMPIKAELGYNLIRKAFKCREMNEEDYEMMKDTVFKRVKTDSIMRTEQECQWSIP